jgi:hypothetical protein
MDYEQTAKYYVPNCVMRIPLSEVDSRTSNQNFCSFFVIATEGFLYT